MWYIYHGAGYKEVVGTLLQAVTSEEQLSRVLDGFDIDGDTVCNWCPSSVTYSSLCIRYALRSMESLIMKIACECFS
jgi:hypothetical protein